MISLFGYGKIMQSWSKILAPCRIYDDKFSEISHDIFGNILLPSSEFLGKFGTESSLEIVSPGIPPSSKMVQNAKNLTSEYDFFYQNGYNKSECSIWISGTNGKTTTTQMITHLLKDFGASSGGNIGIALCDIPQSAKILVLETSSFMLHYTDVAKPDIYALLPITPDHLSWHSDFGEYVASKLKPLRLMGVESSAIIPRIYKDSREAREFRGKLYLYDNVGDLAENFGLDLGAIGFKGAFLLDAALALGVEKIAKNTISYDLINEFKIGGHRVEEFSDERGRIFVDDSKATNIDAVLEALKIYREKRIFLILGGDNKGVSLEPLISALRDYRISVFAIGTSTEHIGELCESFGVECELCVTLESAMSQIKARFNDKDNEICLLSPSCSSLDQFKSYQERGELFKKLALK